MRTTSSVVSLIYGRNMFDQAKWALSTKQACRAAGPKDTVGVLRLPGHSELMNPLIAAVPAKWHE